MTGVPQENNEGSKRDLRFSAGADFSGEVHLEACLREQVQVHGDGEEVPGLLAAGELPSKLVHIHGHGRHVVLWDLVNLEVVILGAVCHGS